MAKRIISSLGENIKGTDLYLIPFKKTRTGTNKYFTLGEEVEANIVAEQADGVIVAYYNGKKLTPITKYEGQVVEFQFPRLKVKLDENRNFQLVSNIDGKVCNSLISKSGQLIALTSNTMEVAGKNIYRLEEPFGDHECSFCKLEKYKSGVISKRFSYKFEPIKSGRFNYAGIPDENDLSKEVLNQDISMFHNGYACGKLIEYTNSQNEKKRINHAIAPTVFFDKSGKYYKDFLSLLEEDYLRRKYNANPIIEDLEALYQDLEYAQNAWGMSYDRRRKLISKMWSEELKMKNLKKEFLIYKKYNKVFEKIDKLYWRIDKLNNPSSKSK